MPRKTVKGKPKRKVKAKKELVAKGRDIAQFRGTGAQVIVQLPPTRRARRAPIREKRAQQIMPVPMMVRPDALVGQQSESERLAQRIGTMQSENMSLRGRLADAVRLGNADMVRSLNERMRKTEGAIRNLQGDLAGRERSVEATPLESERLEKERAEARSKADAERRASQRETPAFAPNYTDMTLARLRQEASAAKIPGRSGMNKQQLIEALQRASRG